MKSYIYKLVLHVCCNSALYQETPDSEEIYAFMRKKDALDMYKKYVVCSDISYTGATLTKEKFSGSPRYCLGIAVQAQRGGESELIAESMYSQEMIDKENKRLDIIQKKEFELEYGVDDE